MKMNIMTCVTITAALIGMAVLPTSEAQEKQKKAPAAKVRIGTFDSRAIALVYYRSDAIDPHSEELKARYEKAKAAGDEERIKQLEAEFKVLQEIAHKQTFSTWPVDNILEQIEDQIPAIAKQADVEIIVCKWDIVYQKDGIEFIDVTELMVQPFKPDEEAMRIITEQFPKQDPASLNVLERRNKLKSYRDMDDQISSYKPDPRHIGRYVDPNTPSNYIDLKPDGSIVIEEDGNTIQGTYAVVQDNVVIFTMPGRGKNPIGELDEGKLITLDGEVWTK
jgi:hypothetical protein